ncbi:MAG: hypothetical protein M0D53_12365 [Flavobacterium sp. JAD_PAG50586_2]|nr:MAG: hypothetical protein M0D53_12365 [Flavobacterium sp. JAD_PAG50586_2]
MPGKSTTISFYQAQKFFTLSLQLFFDDALKANKKISSKQSKIAFENGKHLQKTTNATTECDGAAARASVLLFIC